MERKFLSELIKEHNEANRTDFTENEIRQIAEKYKLEQKDRDFGLGNKYSPEQFSLLVKYAQNNRQLESIKDQIRRESILSRKGIL